MIRFSQFFKSYNNAPVIGADLDLPNGVYWLKGENGSGKTTLLRSVAGLIPFDGTIAIAGTSMKERMAYRLLVNYAEAEPLYPSFLTGYELIRFHEQTRSADTLKTQFYIDALGAAGYLANPVGTYSSGMLKKLSLILAFIGNPALILLDEPLITLDVESVSKLQQLIGRAYASGTGFIITSHQQITLDDIPVRRLGIDQRKLVLVS